MTAKSPRTGQGDWLSEEFYTQGGDLGGTLFEIMPVADPKPLRDAAYAM